VQQLFFKDCQVIMGKNILGVGLLLLVVVVVVKGDRFAEDRKLLIFRARK